MNIINYQNPQMQKTKRILSQPTSQAAAVGGVGIGSDHEESGEAVVLEDDLMNDATARFPEAESELLRGRGEEFVDFAVDVVGTRQISRTAITGLQRQRVATIMIKGVFLMSLAGAVTGLNRNPVTIIA